MASFTAYPFGGRHWLPSGQPAPLGPVGWSPTTRATRTGTLQSARWEQLEDAGQLTTSTCPIRSGESRFTNET